MSREQEEKSLSTADFIATPDTQATQRETPAAERTVDPAPQEPVDAGKPSSMPNRDEPLAALFPADVAGDFQSRWDAVQIGFVDDPGEAVRKADELVAEVMRSLAESFADERAGIESALDQKDSSASTENMRVALRRYRSFFQRLLSL